MRNNKYKVGIVGTGHIANSFHIPAWKKINFLNWFLCVMWTKKN